MSAASSSSVWVQTNIWSIKIVITEFWNSLHKLTALNYHQLKLKFSKAKPKTSTRELHWNWFISHVVCSIMDSHTYYSYHHLMMKKYNLREFVLLSKWRSQMKQLVMVGIRNFQVCARCRNHGIRKILKGHKKACNFKQCGCDKCLVTKDRQSFIAKEIAMHRYEIKNKTESTDDLTSLKLNIVRKKTCDVEPKRVEKEKIDIKAASKHTNRGEVRRDQMCSRCRNHGFNQLLRGHKNACPFASCICPKCEITKKRREIMAKQIKDYRNLKSSDCSISSPEIVKSPETIFYVEEMNSEQFVDYEPMENRDLFFMIQSLFEKYANQNVANKIQLVHAFASLARGDWEKIEKSLEQGNYSVVKFVAFWWRSLLCRVRVVWTFGRNVMWYRVDSSSLKILSKSFVKFYFFSTCLMSKFLWFRKGKYLNFVTYVVINYLPRQGQKDVAWLELFVFLCPINHQYYYLGEKKSF